MIFSSASAMPFEPGPPPFTPPGVAFSEAYKPLWHFFRFQDDEQEAQYRQTFDQLSRFAGLIWCIFHIIIAVLVPSLGVSQAADLERHRL